MQGSPNLGPRWRGAWQPSLALSPVMRGQSHALGTWGWCAGQGQPGSGTRPRPGVLSLEIGVQRPWGPQGAGLIAATAPGGEDSRRLGSAWVNTAGFSVAEGQTHGWGGSLAGVSCCLPWAVKSLPGGAVVALSPRTGGWGAFAFPRGHPPILSSAAALLLPRAFPARFAWVVAARLLFPSSVWTDHPALYLADASHGPCVPLKECDDPGPYVYALHPF